MRQIKKVGVIGLGLLGRGIAACLLGKGFEVVGWNRSKSRHEEAREHIAVALAELRAAGDDVPTDWQKHYTPATDLQALAECDYVIESIVEDMAIKQKLYDQLEQIIDSDVPVASNTSALPITQIQTPRKHPERFVGMHWGEPGHILRFVEVIKGDKTTDEVFDATAELAVKLGKEPSLVRKDIRGFVTNRLMYAMLREALYLVEQGVADVETIDRSFRNDMGWWATIAGPFRWMDLTGIPAYAAVAKDLFPELSNQTTLPRTMQAMLDKNAEGITNGQGFYRYTPEQAAHWQKVWTDFTWDVRKLAEKYVPMGHESETPVEPIEAEKK